MARLKQFRNAAALTAALKLRDKRVVTSEEKEMLDLSHVNGVLVADASGEVVVVKNLDTLRRDGSEISHGGGGFGGYNRE